MLLFPQARLQKSRVRYCLLLAALTFGMKAVASPSAPELDQVAQLPAANSLDTNTYYEIRLEGDVWWANPAANQLVLHDVSGTQKLELDLRGQIVEAGQKVRIQGNGTVARVA